MTTQNIRVIFFDLGKTLIYPKQNWQPVLRRSDRALTESLISSGVDVEPKTFPYHFIERLNKYYTDREVTLRENTTYKMFAELLQEQGFNDIPDSVIRKALNAKYAITQSNWHLEEDAHEMLQSLKDAGFNIALISNAGDDPDVQALLNKHDLRQYFSTIFTSATTGYRKPHPKIFKDAMQAMDVSAAESVMVGDTLNADIKGANALGIYSVWINRRVDKNPKILEEIRPQAVISTLAELPALIRTL